MILNKAFDHYRQHLSRMVKRSTSEDYNKRLAVDYSTGQRCERV